MNVSSDKFFFAKLGDLVSRAERNGVCGFSDFLDERQCAEAELWCRRNAGSLRYKFWGGFSEASRKMLAVYPDYCEDYILEEFPFMCVTFTYRKEDKLTHRDFLGTFMGMRMKREIIGDIVVGEGIAQAFVTDVAGKLISTTVSKIGRTGVKCFTDRPFELEVKQNFAEISGTVASLRLDCVVALAMNVSREKASAFIRADKVDVNHFTASSVSGELKEGDILSIRGCGRFILSGINGFTKKNRLHIVLKKFI
ncbi:MAG: YlmH/Sll1252 family protein [Ruminococcus flavefaciens]|nr:YlmH/Sll1252 family protein [Ruminococcus flavefaciens]MCM1229504.1 YlmH/Sll1252 family protein [Ruminococcus flavefaciens]